MTTQPATAGAVPPALQPLVAAGICVAPAALTAAQQEDLGAAAPAWRAVPRDAAQVQQLLRSADTDGLRVIPMGAGTALGLGQPPTACDVLLDLTAQDRIVEHAVDDFVITVEAGCKLRTLQDHLQQSGQWLACVPPDAEQATLGGMLGGAATSLVAAAHGTLRRHLLGVRAVLADGTDTRAGGRVVKNVAGYDLMKLYHGSLGTLAVIVEVSLRLRPLPRCDRELVGEARTAESLAAFTAGLRRLPVPAAGAHYWCDASGAGRIHVRLQGDESAVAEQLEPLQAAHAGQLQPAEPAQAQALAAILSRGTAAGTVQFALHGQPSQIAYLHETLLDFQRRAPGGGAFVLDLDRGLAWFKGQAEPAARGEWHELLTECRRRWQLQQLTLTLHAMPVELRQHLPCFTLSAGEQQLARRLRQQFDPRDTLSPGRLDVPSA